MTQPNIPPTSNNSLEVQIKSYDIYEDVPEIEQMLNEGWHMEHKEFRTDHEFEDGLTTDYIFIMWTRRKPEPTTITTSNAKPHEVPF